MAFFLFLGASWLASVAGQAISYRRSSGERRQQLKRLLSGSAIAGACFVLNGAVPTNASGALRVVAGVITAGFLAMPLSIGVAILKYHLFDIDRIISRTLAYATVTGLLAGGYAAIVLLATRAVRITEPVAVAGATLAAAAAFSPLRRRVQRAVDRRFNRARYDADRTVAAFAARLHDAVDLDDVRRQLLDTVRQSLEPGHLAGWIRKPD